MPPESYFDSLFDALSLVQNNSVFTLGQEKVYPEALQCNNNITADIANGTMVPCPVPPLVPAE